MKKQFFKRKRQGMALVFTLMVSVVVLAIASTYLGMVGSSAKTARSYTKEALALSLAQVGLNATLNVMGVPSNWDSSSLINKFSRLNNNNGGLFIGTSGSQIIYNDTALSVDQSPNLRHWFYDSTGNTSTFFLSTDNTINNAVFYSCGPMEIRDSNDTTKNAYLIIGVTPENNAASNININYNLSKNNLTYSVGVASLIFDSPRDNLERNLDNLNHLVSSRILKYRVSSVFPGSIYQNMAAADFPGTNHANESYFGYPNWADNTANAAFMDENTKWDGGIRIDGASTLGDRYGAPRENANGSFSTGNRDTAGVLRISLLDRANNSIVISGNASNITNISDNELPLIGKKAFSRKNISYYDMVNNNETNINGNLLNKVCLKGSKENDTSLDINTVWQRRDSSGNITDSLLSGIDNNGNKLNGLYKKMKTNNGTITSTNAARGYFKFGISEYQPDPMYANETMEAPTVKVTITAAGTTGNSSTYDKYTIEKIGYVRDNNTASGWKKVPKTIATVYNNSTVDGMLYFEGANVQVQGEASQPISIVSDVNPDIESANYKIENNLPIDSSLSNIAQHFNRNLTYPNVRNSSNQYKYVDPQLNESTGMWEMNSSITNTTGANSLISTIPMNDTNYTTVNNTDEANYKLKLDTGDNYVFPTYDDSQQPSGNITIVGDLKVKSGTNPSVGIIAKNRVLLNDMTHSTLDAPRDKAYIAQHDADDNDGILTVNAIVASESHNMCFDFNNMSKNLNYSNNTNGKNFVTNNKTKAPGNNVENVTYAGTGGTDAAREQDREHTNYGMLMDKNLAIQLGLYNEGTNKTVTNNASRPSYVGEEVYHSDDNSKVYIYFNKYRNFPDSAKQMIWSDTYMGAIRPSNTNGFIGSPKFYSNGTLNFTGMIISRFGDINADAGVRDNATGKRKDQLGYVNQFINFDTNLQDNAAPWFSMTSQRYESYVGFIQWNILSYVDIGSLNWRKENY